MTDFFQNLVRSECKSSHIQICMGSWLRLAILECICYKKNLLELKQMCGLSNNLGETAFSHSTSSQNSIDTEYWKS